MKKPLLAALLGLMSLSAWANNGIPFVGTRQFDFGGNVGAYSESYTMSISANGQATVKLQTCYSDYCDPARTLYRGKFKSVVGYKDEGGQYYLQFEKTKVRLLNAQRKQEYGCDSVATDRNNPCIGKYYRP